MTGIERWRLFTTPELREIVAALGIPQGPIDDDLACALSEQAFQVLVARLDEAAEGRRRKEVTSE